MCSAAYSDWFPSTPEINGPEADRLGQYGAVAIHFWAPWNRIDVRMDVSIQAVAPRFADRVEFVSCNIDLAENAELCRRFGVLNVPTIGVLIDGRPRRPIVGLREPVPLAEEIESRLRPQEPKPWWALWRHA